jgi:hypothetical protein
MENISRAEGSPSGVPLPMTSHDASVLCSYLRNIRDLLERISNQLEARDGQE